MPNRRQFMQAGMSALMLGLLRRGGAAQLMGGGRIPWLRTSPLRGSRPFLTLPRSLESVMVGDLPFAAGFTGDYFPNDHIPFHSAETQYPGGVLPAVTETVDIAIVGGGLSGLSTAYMLREHHPVLFEARARFGGVSAGEIWNDTHYSLGGAYFITPDKGTFLDSLYQELGLDQVYRLSVAAADPVEFQGRVIDSVISSGKLTPEELIAFERYAAMVAYYVENYPEIPLPERGDVQWIIDLDQRSLKQDIEEGLRMPVPPLLAAAVQGYCYSSFNAGWEQVSAAAGWNFIAAEEYGRWVCPGGNAWVTDVLWRKLIEYYAGQAVPNWPRLLRPGTHVVDVRPDGTEVDRRGLRQRLFRVTYRNEAGDYSALLARRVVMACSKHICKYILHDLIALDVQKFIAMNQVQTYSYLVVNILLEKPVKLDFYDLFLLGDGIAPMSPEEAQQHSRVTDVLSGDYAEPPEHPRSVLTLYWPLPWGDAVFSLIVDSGWQDYADRLAPQVHAILELLGISRETVRQVRVSRWGHAMPIARPYFIADGTAAELRRPYQEHIYFVNQDNWALPAFETCLLEAHAMSPQIAEGL